MPPPPSQSKARKVEPAPAPPAPAEAPAAAEPDAQEAKPKPADHAKPTAEEQAPADAEPAADTKAQGDADAGTEPVAPVGEQNVPDRPEVVKPAGQQLEQPTKAKLSGPRVVRIEKPEPVAPPRRRGGAGPGGPGGRPPRLAPGEVEGITRSRGPSRGGGVRGGGPGGPSDSGRGGGGGGGGKSRRTLSSRRGRTADALPSGPAKFSKADMEELDARLKGSSGFLKQRRRDLRKRDGGGGPAQTAVQTGGKVEITEPITIKALSAATGIKTAQIIKHLFRQGVMSTINSTIDTEAAMEVALEYDIELDVREQQTAEQQVEQEFELREVEDERPRPPIVTVLGHVDHGKTSLLDRIRKADVAAHESGGITQHVGAYRVTVEGNDGQDKTVVFLDTPGHAAFTSMRSRGARMTDLVVLVVAADDGVMPQTIESINHARAAEVPVVVALNKTDLPQATEENVHKIYGQLAEHGLNPSDWGGETEVIKVSAETGDGVTDLLEVLDYQAELLELTADYQGAARGTVIEAEMQPGRGSVARTLVQEGNLSVGDFIVIGRAFGRVRDMTDDRGNQVQTVGPATPVELSGIDQIPDAGDKFYVTKTLKKAEDVATHYRETERTQQLASKTKVTLDNFADAVAAGNIRELRVIVKADVQGSVDVLRESLEKIGNNEVAVRVLHAAVGGVTESDVLLADASDAVIIGFHVSLPTAVREIAEAREVEVRQYRVIYDVTDEITKSLEGMLTPETREEQIGQAEVREVFRIGGIGAVAGCLVTEGQLERGAKARVERDGIVVTSGRTIESLRRVKDEVKSVQNGTECGARLNGFEDLKNGDTLVCYREQEVARTLED